MSGKMVEKETIRYKGFKTEEEARKFLDESMKFLKEQVEIMETIWHNAFVYPKVFAPTKDLIKLDKKIQRIKAILEEE